MAYDSVVQAIKTLAPGVWLTYHNGLLASDRTRSPAVWAAGDAAYKAYQEGRVALIQRKLGYCDYEYIAVGLPRRGNGSQVNPATQVKDTYHEAHLGIARRFLRDSVSERL
jgi:hypothetical protein